MRKILRVRYQLEHVYGAGDSLRVMEFCERRYTSWAEVFLIIGPYRHQPLENTILASIE